MGPIEAFTTAWRKSFTYGGKATRAEFWWFYLVDLVVMVILAVVTSAIAAATEAAFFVAIPFLYSIAQIFPTLAVTIRRLRDSGKEWVWIFINLVPLIGGFWFLYLLIQPSVVG